MEKQFGAGVGGTLFRDGKLLLLRRVMTRKVAPGLYETPGGKVHFGESPQDALRREFKEETGIDVRVGDPYAVWHFVTDDGTTQYVCTEFVLEETEPGAEVVVSDEHDDVRWASREEMEVLPLSPEMRAVVRMGFARHG